MKKIKTKPKLSNRKLVVVAITCYFFLFTFYSCAQDSIRISGEFQNNTRYAMVVAQKFDLGSIAIAAIPIDRETGNFSITIPRDQLIPGVYRFQYSQSSQEYIDVILNGEEAKIHFIIDAFSEDKQPVFTHSKENKLWYDYLKIASIDFFKIQLLQQFLSSYPSVEDEVYIQNTKFYESFQEEYTSKRKDFLDAHPNTWAYEMVANEPLYFPNPRDDWRLQLYYQRQNYWKAIDAGNPALINTPLYTDLILRYIQYYINPDMEFSEEERTKGFKKSAEEIMQAFSGQPETEEFAYKYLSLGFKEIGEEDVLKYLDETYAAIAEQCLEDQEKEAFEKRMAGYNAMAPGSKAPDIELKIESEKLKVNSPSISAMGIDDLMSLYDIKASQTLLVFWASWCPHCMEEMPKVDEWAKNNPETQVVAISLDDDKSAYKAAISSLENLLHSCDFKKWEGKAVNDYYIYGTPTFIVLDKDKRIIGKHSSFKGFVK